MKDLFGYPDIIFGKQDNVGGLTIDNDIEQRPEVVADWARLPFEDEAFDFGYWDPPYFGYIGVDGDVHYNRLQPCYDEICRVSKRLALLSPLIYPKPQNWIRKAVIAITYGPNKIIRALQVFERK